MDAQALGRYLRQSREAKELSLEDAEGALRIRRRILESFELGDFNVSDASTVQIRGFIRNYASYLGLDEERVVQYYEVARSDAPQAPARGRRSKNGRRKKRDTQPNPIAPRSITDTNPSLPVVPLAAIEAKPARGMGLLSALFRLIVAGAALAVIVFVIVQLTQQPATLVSATEPAPDILGQLPPSPTFTFAPPTDTPNSLLPTPLPGAGSTTTFTGDGVLVIVDITERTWLRVETDGVEQYAGIVTLGTHMEIPAQQTVILRAANADALEVIWNGQEQGSFGGRGQLVDVTFTRADVQIMSGPAFDPTSPFTPTPLPTEAIDMQAAIQELTPSNTPGPSPTPSETPTITLTPTVTDTPSNTPTPSDTPTITMTPTITLTPSDTPTITRTPTQTLTPTLTRTPTITPTPTLTLTPSPTAILPPRMTPENPTPTKSGA